MIIAPWCAYNFGVYGDATGASAARPLMSSFFMSPMVNLGTLRLEELLPTYWFGEPVFQFYFWPFAGVAVGAAMVMAVFGVSWYLFRPDDEGPGFGEDGSSDSACLSTDDAGQSCARLPVNFILAAFLIGAAVTLLIPFGSGIGGVPGRYLYPLIPVVSVLIMFGIERLLGSRRAIFVSELLLVWMVVWESLNFLAYIQGL